jgi:uncharacterized protein (TIGR03067 family)
VSRHVTVRVNGLTTVDQDLDAADDEGYFLWHVPNTGTEVTIRDIRFRELPRAGQPKTDEDYLEGTWVAVAGERKGFQKLSADELAKFPVCFYKIVLNGPGEERIRTLLLAVGPEGKGVRRGGYKLYAGAEPRRISWETEAGVTRGLYRFRGDDLELCFAPPGQPFPTDFVMATKGGGELLLKLVRRPQAAPAVKPLFNGKDLSGWKAHADGGADAAKAWTVGGNLVICSGNPAGTLRTDRDYKNFALELEWRFPRARTLSGGGPVGMELSLWAEPDALKKPRSFRLTFNTSGDGSLFCDKGARSSSLKGLQRNFEYQVKPLQEWNRLRVVCNDGTLAVFVNGVSVLKVDDCEPRRGAIVLHAGGEELQYRNVEIQELP